MKKPISITCNRWFQKSFGNTYFSSHVVFDDGTEEKIISFAYGYGDHCLYETLNALAKGGYVVLPEGFNATLFLREVMDCDYFVNDVKRKKDM